MRFFRFIPWWLIVPALLAGACRNDAPPAPAPAAVAPVPAPDYPMVRLGPGSFDMGSPDDEPARHDDERRHRVTLSRAFDLGKYEVTQALWSTVMGANPSSLRGCGPNCPVENVSWLDAVDFCNRFSALAGRTPCYSGTGNDVVWARDCTGYRLPTEAEWEYAARAGAVTALAAGPLTATDCAGDAVLDSLGWYCGNSAVNYQPCLSAADGGGAPCAGTHPVGLKMPNAWGFHDMHGNATEWVWDRYGPYPTGPVTDPTGPASGDTRVLRGGGWRALAMHCRAANRRVNAPDYRMSVLGFRVARDAP